MSGVFFIYDILYSIRLEVCNDNFFNNTLHEVYVQAYIKQDALTDRQFNFSSNVYQHGAVFSILSNVGNLHFTYTEVGQNGKHYKLIWEYPPLHMFVHIFEDRCTCTIIDNLISFMTGVGKTIFQYLICVPCHTGWRSTGQISWKTSSHIKKLSQQVSYL